MVPMRSSMVLKAADSLASLNLAPRPANRPEAFSPVLFRAAPVLW